MKREIVRRYAHNPILTKAEIPYAVETVHNAAVVKHDGEYIMLFRSHLRTGRSIIGLARSPDGFRFTADPQPFLVPERDGPFAAYEEFGVEDPRVTLLEGWYVITYSAYSRSGVRIALARTKDFTRGGKGLAHHAGGPSQRGPLSGEVRRTLRPPGPSALGDHAVVDLDLLLARPVLLGTIRTSHQTRDLSLGRDEDRPRRAAFKTEQGWLSIYHGVFRTMDGAVYRLGVALHDLQNPAKVIGVSDSWILQPEDPWETTGYVHNVVFTCGAVPEPDGTVKIYWGAADTVMCVGEADIQDLVDLCLNSGRPAR